MSAKQPSNHRKASREMSRRTYLRGLGACIAVPAFESLVGPLSGTASTAFGASAAQANPLRTAFLYVPNGVNVKEWNPQGEGKDYELSKSLKVMESVREHFQVFSGFKHENGTAGRDGAGDHARALASFLTGARPRKTAGADIRLGISVDQVAANAIGDATRFASLELSCDASRNAGNCDSGYSCAYQHNLSWKSETSPVASETNPRLAFERLFGDTHQSVEERIALQKSILDFVADDTRSLAKKLGRNDRRKLGEYLDGVRSIEKRIASAENFELPDVTGVPVPSGIPASYREHIRLMYDILVLAFKTDQTRVATFMLAHDGSNRRFQELEIGEGHHELSHHKHRPEALEKIARIDRFYAEEFTGFLSKLRDTKEADGSSLLDNSMILYGRGLADPNRHDHSNLPVILAGHGRGELNPGRRVVLNEPTPLSNLFVTMLNKMGVSDEQFGDSDGRIEDV